MCGLLIFRDCFYRKAIRLNDFLFGLNLLEKVFRLTQNFMIDSKKYLMCNFMAVIVQIEERNEFEIYQMLAYHMRHIMSLYTLAV